MITPSILSFVCAPEIFPFMCQTLFCAGYTISAMSVRFCPFDRTTSNQLISRAARPSVADSIFLLTNAM